VLQRRPYLKEEHIESVLPLIDVVLSEKRPAEQ
jgi:hypothetical protein